MKKLIIAISLIGLAPSVWAVGPAPVEPKVRCSLYLKEVPPHTVPGETWRFGPHVGKGDTIAEATEGAIQNCETANFFSHEARDVCTLNASRSENLRCKVKN